MPAMHPQHPLPYVAYYRVSTQRQGRSGLGLEAQRRAILDHVARGGRKLIGEFTDIESGKNPDRPNLGHALKLCRLTAAKLVVARLDRLARNVAFVSRLMETKVDFEAVDFPQANRFTVHILAAVAEYEAGLISERVRVALAAAKARGVKLGGFRSSTGCPEGLAKARAARTRNKVARDTDMRPVIEEIRAAGVVSNSLIARELNARGILPPRGGRWTGPTIRPVLRRLGLGMSVMESRHFRGTAKSAWMEKVAPIVEEIYLSGRTSARAIADELNARGIRGWWGGKWHGCQVPKFLMRTRSTQWQPLYVARSQWLDRLRPVINELKAAGCRSPGAIARELNTRGIGALLGGRWRPYQVRNLLQRLGTLNLGPSRSARSVAMMAFASKLAPVVREIRRAGHKNPGAVARELNLRGIPAYLGGTWGRCQARQLLLRLRVRPHRATGKRRKVRGKLKRGAGTRAR